MCALWQPVININHTLYKYANLLLLLYNIYLSSYGFNGYLGAMVPLQFRFLLTSIKRASFALITSFNKLLLNCHRIALELTRRSLKYSMSLAPVSSYGNKLAKKCFCSRIYIDKFDICSLFVYPVEGRMSQSRICEFL